jgi:hypothetical protein
VGAVPVEQGLALVGQCLRASSTWPRPSSRACASCWRLQREFVDGLDIRRDRRVELAAPRAPGAWLGVLAQVKVWPSAWPRRWGA